MTKKVVIPTEQGTSDEESHSKEKRSFGKLSMTRKVVIPTEQGTSDEESHSKEKRCFGKLSMTKKVVIPTEQVKSEEETNGKKKRCFGKLSMTKKKLSFRQSEERATRNLIKECSEIFRLHCVSLNMTAFCLF